MVLVPSLELGGSENALIRLVNMLGNENYQFSICYFEYNKEYSYMVNRIKNKNTKVHYLYKKNGIDLGIIRKLRHLIKQDNIGIIHARNWSTVLYGILAGLMMFRRIEFIVDIRGKIKSQKHYLILKILAIFIKKYIVVTSDIKEALVIKAGIKRSKVEVIHNGVDIGEFNRKEDVGLLRKNIGIGIDTLVIGSVGRLAEVKDYPTLLKAFSIVKKHIQNSKLILVGDGPEKANLIKLSNELKVNEDILFFSPQDEIEKFYQIMDIFVLPSLFEGSSNSLLEAMASNLVCIATQVGGNKEIIVNGVSGLLFTPGDYQKLSEIIIDINNKKMLRDNLKQNALIRVKEQFSLSDTVESYKRVYERVD